MTKKYILLSMRIKKHVKYVLICFQFVNKNCKKCSLMLKCMV